MKTIKTKLKDFNKKYEKMTRPRKAVLLSGIFIGFSVLMMGTLLFPSLDKYKESSENYELLKKEKINLVKEKEEAELKKAYKSEPNLLKQKKDLLVEIDQMLKTNKNGNYIAPEAVPKLIENIVNNINQVTVVSFRNTPNVSTSNNEGNQSNVLVKHHFTVEVNGTFQGIYDVLSNLEKIDGINISLVEIKKANNQVDATFNFYVINTNKNILNF